MTFRFISFSYGNKKLTCNTKGKINRPRASPRKSHQMCENPKPRTSRKKKSPKTARQVRLAFLLSKPPEVIYPTPFEEDDSKQEEEDFDYYIDEKSDSPFEWLL